MSKKDKRIDMYIAKAAEFAQPILQHIRKTIHAACPQVEEILKWSMPFFVYRGNLCHMAAFKQHCGFGFWKGTLIFGQSEKEGMGNFGKITKVADLPGTKVLAGYVKKAMALNEAGAKVRKPKKSPKTKELKVPQYFLAALKKNRKARETFENFPYSHKQEYVVWITEAKREETRDKRMATALQWLAAGKSRNWKWEKC